MDPHPLLQAHFQSTLSLGQVCNTAARSVESKQCPVSSDAYLTPNSCQLNKNLLNPGSRTREAHKVDYHLNGDSLAPPRALCEQPHGFCEG